MTAGIQSLGFGYPYSYGVRSHDPDRMHSSDPVSRFLELIRSCRGQGRLRPSDLT
jgi:hypothetical protein